MYSNAKYKGGSYYDYNIGGMTITLQLNDSFLERKLAIDIYIMNSFNY